MSRADSQRNRYGEDVPKVWGSPISRVLNAKITMDAKFERKHPHILRGKFPTTRGVAD